MRGLWLPGPDAFAAVADRMRPGATIDTSDILTGSREAPYPGQVVLTMTPLAEGSRARDTSAFSYAEEQREAAFAPGARFSVTSAEHFEPGVADLRLVRQAGDERLDDLSRVAAAWGAPPPELRARPAARPSGTG